eukprot:TRINITY_DN47848_c0_g1_i1.p2 TRINITY_DN47848_c0_g1~~TRINITY_DN47848_c0_g1_i1.p2  ORF type:complete len:156 (-),score=59.22 TRINITY_DN47848_c0_g1_i1:112-579(-)
MSMVIFFFFKQKTAYEMLRSLVGSEMCIRDRYQRRVRALSNTKAPKGVIVLSAHDVSGATASGVPVVRVGTSPTPDVEYDYDGFPDRGLVYTVKYPAHGPDASVASEVVKELETKLEKLLAQPGTKARPMKIEANPKSKFDHGVFIPMLLSLIHI